MARRYAVPSESGTWYRHPAIPVPIPEKCEGYGIHPPTFEEDAGFVIVTFRAQIGPSPQVTPQVTPHVAPQVTPQVVAVLKAARIPRSRAELQQAASLKDRKHFRKAYLDPLVEAGLLEMTIPDKPQSSQQRYRTTVAGERLIERGEE